MIDPDNKCIHGPYFDTNSDQDTLAV